MNLCEQQWPGHYSCWKMIRHQILIISADFFCTNYSTNVFNLYKYHNTSMKLSINCDFFWVQEFFFYRYYFFFIIYAANVFWLLWQSVINTSHRITPKKKTRIIFDRSHYTLVFLQQKHLKNVYFHNLFTGFYNLFLFYFFTVVIIVFLQVFFFVELFI